MHYGTYGNILQGECVTNFGSGFCARHDRHAYFKSIRSYDVPFFAIGIKEQSDASRTIRVVFNGLYDSGNTVFVSLEVDQTIFALVATANITHRPVSFIVAATRFSKSYYKRLFWCGSSDIVKCTNNLVSLPRCCGL